VSEADIGLSPTIAVMGPTLHRLAEASRRQLGELRSVTLYKCCFVSRGRIAECAPVRLALEAAHHRHDVTVSTRPRERQPTQTKLTRNWLIS
jgi:hypothetical protein